MGKILASAMIVVGTGLTALGITAEIGIPLALGGIAMYKSDGDKKG